MKDKKLLALFLGAALGCGMLGCSTPGERPPSERVEEEDGQGLDSQETDKEKQKPLLDADATDEELLDLVKDDTQVVKEKEFAQTIKGMKEKLEEFSGQLYQMEGYYTEQDGVSYITDNAEGKEGNSLPLRYIQEPPKSGTKIRVTGVAEEGDDKNTVFSVVVIETLD